MSENGDLKKQVRLTDENHAQLSLIKEACPWHPSLTTIANQAIRDGMATVRASFVPDRPRTVITTATAKKGNHANPPKPTVA